MNGEQIGQVLAGLEFEDEHARSQALQAAKRFEKFVYHNRTRAFEIELCLFQGYDTTPPIPSGYVERTGVTVGGINIRPGGTRTIVLQSQIKCLADKIGCSANVKHIQSGEVTEFHHPDKYAPSGKYFVTVHFGIKQNANAHGEQSDELSEEFIAESAAIPVTAD